MAESKDKSAVNEELELIDPLYKKFAKSVVRALADSDFYEYFMSAIGGNNTQVQFSNRRMEKLVDTEWVDTIESALNAMQNIIANPRNVIREDELIVNVANAKKTNSDVVRHLANHASLVEDFNEETGDVRPNKLMQKFREDSIGQVYENRVVFTTMEMAYQFVKIRHDALFEAMSDEFGAKLKVTTDIANTTETVHLDSFLHIRDIDNAMDTDEKNREIFDRISRLYRLLSVNMHSGFAQHMAKYPRVKGNVTKTNVLKKNKNYRVIMELFEFLRGYTDIGYTIKIIEQNPVVNEVFQTDIYHNILFNYLVLKSHLERDKDRRLPAPMRQKKHSLKPKFIKEIIEELTEDYDLPDVEVRKVLIEELTKAQLMQEEAAERRRLVEEQAQRKKAEEERIRNEKKAEKERLRLEREAERERIRQEKEAEKQRLLIERMEREQEDRRRSLLFKKEMEHFTRNLDERLYERSEQIVQETVARQDFEDAAYILEETERIKQEEAERARVRRREELDRRKREEFEAQQRALAEEAERKEQLRLQKIREEELLKQQLKEQEEQQQAEKLRKDLESVAQYRRELFKFHDNILVRFRMRDEEKNRQSEAIRIRKEQRENRRFGRQ